MKQFSTSLFTVWARGIRRGLTTVWRERGWKVSLSSLLGVFLLLQLLLLVIVSVQGVESLLKTRTDLRLELQNEASEQMKKTFFSAVEQLPPVTKAVYSTKENAYNQMRQRDPELIGFLEEFGLDNPFPDTIIVTLNSLDDYESFANFVGQQQWHTVVEPNYLSQVTAQEAHVHQLLRFMTTSRTLAIAFVVLTGVILMLITIELVRSRVMIRAEEILVEHLSGAYTFGILLPFAVEATLILLIAVLGSLGVMAFMIYVLPQIGPHWIDSGLLMGAQTIIGPALMEMLPYMLGIQLLALPVIAWLGAWLGVLPRVGTRDLALYR